LNIIFQEEQGMSEDQEKQETQSMDSKSAITLDRSRVAKKPYEAPQLTKLGDVAALTNVSVIV
jgi:hypothetical protein